jgi:hypothetical protein
VGILSELAAQEQEAGIFAVVAGARTAGKSTIPGTLPGKTLMLQAELLETGSKSALNLAKELGNDLTVVSFGSVAQLTEVLQDPDIAGFDNVYIDGLSAVTDMLFNTPEIKKATKKNTWDGFRDLWIAATDLLLLAKGMSATHNVFFSLAIKEKYDAQGNLIAVEPETKGNATIGSIQKLCPTVLYTVAESWEDDDGEVHTQRRLITGYRGVYAGRIDSLLDKQNPGIMDADLSKVIQLIKGE